MTLSRDRSNADPRSAGAALPESAGRPEDPREQRRRELRVAECGRRGVRFLPAQAMRAIYEKEGLL